MTVLGWTPAHKGGQYLPVYMTLWLLITSIKGVCLLSSHTFYFPPLYVCLLMITSVSHPLQFQSTQLTLPSGHGSEWQIAPLMSFLLEMRSVDPQKVFSVIFT